MYHPPRLRPLARPRWHRRLWEQDVRVRAYWFNWDYCPRFTHATYWQFA